MHVYWWGIDGQGLLSFCIAGLKNVTFSGRVSCRDHNVFRQVPGPRHALRQLYGVALYMYGSFIVM